MHICLLTTQDLDADPFPADDWPCDPRPFYPEAAWHVATLKKKTAVAHVTRMIKNGFDIFFNLCDGAADQDIPGIEVVQTLEEAGVPFTGARTPERRQVSSPEDLLRLNIDELRTTGGMDLPARWLDARVEGPVVIDRGVRIGHGCVIGPNVFLEDGCVVGNEVTIRNAVVLRNAWVPTFSEIDGEVLV